MISFKPTMQHVAHRIRIEFYSTQHIAPTDKGKPLNEYTYLIA